MPEKQTRETIEAELNASAEDRIRAEAQSLMSNLEELQQRWLSLSDSEILDPAWKELVDFFEEWTTAAEFLLAGGDFNDLPPDFKNSCDALAGARLSGANLLADVVAARRKKP